MGLLGVIAREDAAAELLRRRRARESLISYAQAIDIPGAPVADEPDAWMFQPVETQLALHHRVMLNELQNCVETPYGRLMIFAPPGSAKSTYASVVTPTWAMGKFPGYKVISTSYAQPAAERSARRCQQICRSSAYAAIWQHKALMQRGNSPIKEWTLTNDSTMLSSGIMGGITSARADLGIIDDPVSGREDADSETIQKKVLEAYQDDFLTRLKPSASIIFIMTRWQENDLAGSILPADYAGESGDILCRDGQVWRVLSIQAENERLDDPLGRPIGGMLWPEWFTDRHWAIYRKNVRTWSALYQQRPAPPTGGQFEKSDFKRYRDTPTQVRWWMSSDLAVTELELGTHPDFSEHIVAGITPSSELYCEDGWSGQKTPDKVIEAGIELVRRFKPLEWLLERGVIWRALKGRIERSMIDSGKDGKKRAMTTLQDMPSEQDKVAKAAALRAMAKAGQVYVKEGSWGDYLIAQCCAFPFGRYDDAVDALAQMARRIEEMYAPKEEPPEKKKRGARPFTPQDIFDREDEEEARRRRDFTG